MLIKYDLTEEKIPDMNANKMNKLCEKILKVVNDNEQLINEVNKLLKLIDKHVTDISSTESTKSGSLVEALISEYKK